MEVITLKELLIEAEKNPHQILYTLNKSNFHKYHGKLNKEEFFNKLFQIFPTLTYTKFNSYKKNITNGRFIITNPIIELNNLAIGFDGGTLILCTEEWMAKYGD